MKLQSSRQNSADVRKQNVDKTENKASFKEQKRIRDTQTSREETDCEGEITEYCAEANHQCKLDEIFTVLSKIG